MFLHRNPFWKFTLFLLFVQLEKFYSDLSQPVASDIDFEYLRMMIMMMMTMMLMMMLMMMTMMMMMVVMIKMILTLGEKMAMTICISPFETTLKSFWFEAVCTENSSKKGQEKTTNTKIKKYKNMIWRYIGPRAVDQPTFSERNSHLLFKGNILWLSISKRYNFSLKGDHFIVIISNF